MEVNLFLLVEAGAKMTWFMVLANATDWMDHRLQQSSPIDIEHSFYQPRFHSRPSILTSPARPPAGSTGLGGSGAAVGGENNDRFESAHDTDRTVFIGDHRLSALED